MECRESSAQVPESDEDSAELLSAGRLALGARFDSTARSSQGREWSAAETLTFSTHRGFGDGVCESGIRRVNNHMVLSTGLV